VFSGRGVLRDCVTLRPFSEGSVRRVLKVAAFVLGMPCLVDDALGQTSTFGGGSIVGVVKDAGGAVLPGVLVEASSPVLIEGARSKETDQTGRYEIRHLRPGLYTLTFTLQAYQTVRRERILIEGSAVRTLDQDMASGSPTDSIVVVAETAQVDVRTTSRQTVHANELLDRLASGRSPHDLLMLEPGVESTSRNVGPIGPNRPMAAPYGGRQDDQRIYVDGFNSGALVSQAISNLVPNPEFAQEVVIQTTSQGAEPETGGVSIDYVPRDGGNIVSGALFGMGTSGQMQGRNLNRSLVDQGAAAPERIEALWDVNPGFGGPIIRNRLWFFGSFRAMRTQIRTSQFYNKNAFQPDNYTYVADPDKPARSVDGAWADIQARVTGAINRTNKLAVTIGDQHRCLCPTGVSPTRAVEAGFNDRNPVQRTYQAELRSTWSSRLFFEVGVQRREIEHEYYPLTAETSGVAPELFANYPQLIGATINNGLGIVPNGFQFHGPGPPENVTGGGPFTFSRRPTFAYRAKVIYETGRHLVKAGIQNTSGYADQGSYSITADRFDRQVRYVFSTLNTPQAVTVFSGKPDAPWFVRNDLDRDMGIYVEDEVRVGWATILAGLRLNLFKSSFPAQSIPETVFGRPAATFAGGVNLDWEDWTPRFSAAFDVTGDRKTALKVTLNKYIQSQSLVGPAISANPLMGGRAILNNFNRRWLDVNGDRVVDCDLSNPQPNLECTSATSASVLNVTPTALTDASVRTGWGRRPYNWLFSLGVQRQLWPGVALDVSYFRRSYGNSLVIDDTACVNAAPATGCREPGNFRSYDITVPIDSRLPGGGGYVLKGFVDPDCTGPAASCGSATAAQIAALAPVNQLVTTRDIGAEQIENWNGIDVSISARGRGLFVRVGTSTGRRHRDECEVWARWPEVQGPGRPFDACEVTEPFRTSF
jgi:hypothetical protein